MINVRRFCLYKYGRFGCTVRNSGYKTANERENSVSCNAVKSSVPTDKNSIEILNFRVYNMGRIDM